MSKPRADFRRGTKACKGFSTSESFSDFLFAERCPRAKFPSKMKTFNGLQGLTSKERGQTKGFSLIEVLIVVVITLIIVGMAIPNMMTVISNARVRAGTTSLSGLLQNCRMMAVKQNKTLTTRFVTVNGATLLGYVKLASDTSPLKDADPQAEWEAPVVMMPTPVGTGHPDAISTSVLGFTPETSEPSFNPRGLPCVYSGGTCANSGFLYYFKDTSRIGNKGWAALSISPAGRIKKWFWSGAAWTD